MRVGAAISRFLHGGAITSEEYSRVRGTLIFEKPDLGRKLVRFWILLILASAIATAGLLADSVATVIGAMIIAPLMLPIMGMAFGISIGGWRAILSSLAVGAGGIATAVVVGWGIAHLMPSTFDPERVGQIMARTSPSLIDLFAALVTGLAGAFALGRKDVSDTLPGVAIAISLVPPLANAGILIALGRLDLAYGSFLLFATNYLAIVLTGAIVFGLMRYPQLAMEHRSRVGKVMAMILVVVMVLVITVPLGLQSYLSYLKKSLVSSATQATQTWLEGSDYIFVSAALDQRETAVDVVIQGSGPVPDTAVLRGDLSGKLLGMDVILEVIPSQKTRISIE